MTVWRSKVPLRFDMLLLVLTASAAVTVFRTTAAWSPATMAIRAICELAIVVVLSVVLSRRFNALPLAQAVAGFAACTAAAYPFVAEFVLRQVGGGSEPLEILMLSSGQLGAVVLASFSHVPRMRGSAVLLGSFLLLFVVTMTSDRATLVLAAIYGALVLWWLMGAYWDRISTAFVASNVERRIPVRISVIGGTAVVMLLLTGIIGTNVDAALALPGILPTSGGTRWYDPHARSGVGDGDATVAAKESAMSFGPVESELFLDSDMPTLYDMFSDMYGEPPRPKKKQERTIGLAPDDNVRDPEQRIARTERSGREFSAVRRSKAERKPRKLDDLDAAAMLYVVGRVPLHLALERFDQFDGRVWSHSGDGDSLPPLRLQQEHGKPWIYVTRVGTSSIHRGLEPSTLKVINLKTNRIPSPPQLAAVHIDRVDQPDFFGWTVDGVACLPARRHIPQLTVVHLRSQGFNLRSLREVDFTETLSAAANTEGGETSDSMSRTAASWTRGVPRGWRQVEAVVEQLRAGFELDPAAQTPEECSDVVAHFLKVRRGPDYLFATSAAVLLRELGYPTRLVTGFYADENRYDHRAKQTVVLGQDVHVWVEVNTGKHTWVPIEPTPGYEPPREDLTWRQWVSVATQSCIAWTANHKIHLLSGLAVVVLLLLARRMCLDAMATGFCRVMGLRSARARLVWTIRLIEWRSWLSGHARPRQTTIAAWYAPLFRSAPDETKPALTQFLDWTDRLLYAPSGVTIASQSEIELACRSAATACTLNLLARNSRQSEASDER